MSFTNSSLVTYTKISPNKNSPRTSKILKITPHHMAGDTTLQAFGNIVANPDRMMSSNYAIDSQGAVGLFCDEADRSWCSSSPDNDHQAVTIEVANDGGAPDWHVSDAALESLVDLCVDICQRNGIEALNYTGDSFGNLTMHKYFKNTECPGPYLSSKFPYIESEVNSRLNNATPEQSKEAFIATVAKLVAKHAPAYNVMVVSPIIAQVILESGWGKQELAIYAKNFVGMKHRENRCPTATGIYYKSSPEEVNGEIIYMTSKFFSFSSLEGSIIGYFDFTNISAYAALKNETDPEQYLISIKKVGYASASDYVEKCMNLIRQYDLTRFDTKEFEQLNLKIGPAQPDDIRTIRNLLDSLIIGYIVDDEYVTTTTAPSQGDYRTINALSNELLGAGHCVTVTPPAFSVGDFVQFTGGNYYVSSIGGSYGVGSAGAAMVTHVAPLAKYPYHVVRSNHGEPASVYGWVAASQLR